MQSCSLDIVLPVHNEAESIEKTLTEMHEALAGIPHRFVICEDGSRDDTKPILRRLESRLPLALAHFEERLGYANAVKNALSRCEAPWIVCLDSDGQCDASDLLRVWSLKEDYDVLIGWRKRRCDSLFRKFLSGGFHLLYRWRLGIPVNDPSCPFVLVRREKARELLPDLGLMKQGFWWEFVGRAWAKGFRFLEFPIHHRPRSAGLTQVYRFSKLPGIGATHVAALFKLPRRGKENERKAA